MNKVEQNAFNTFCFEIGGLSLEIPGVFVESLFLWFWSKFLDNKIMEDAKQKLYPLFLSLLQTKLSVLLPHEQNKRQCFHNQNKI